MSRQTVLKFCFIVGLVFFSIKDVCAWDNIDLELFDLVEEVQPHTFYEILGIDQSANTAEIRRAYRKLSLQLHPDKNKEDGVEVAEQRFRELVAAAEILRDDDKRKRYDAILLNGLPDWRQPVFYYRSVRKMGLLETTILLSIILTLGHYIVIWSMYWERRFELESLIKPKREKKSKKSRTTPATDEQSLDPASILEDEDFLPRPKVRDALPFKVLRLLINSGIQTVHLCQFLWILGKEKWENRNKVEVVEEEEVEEEDTRRREKRPREKQKVFSEIYDFERTTGVDQGNSAIQDVTRTSEAEIKKNSPWTNEDTKSLVKGIARYPGGTTDRWEKIAEDVGRSVSEVLKKAKEMKTRGFIANVDASVQGITGGVDHSVINKQTGKQLVKDNTISLASSLDGEEKHRPAKAMKDRTNMISQPPKEYLVEENEADSLVEELLHDGVETWSQRQQKILETAMTVYPKGSLERWQKIASAVPGKSKEECILRYKELVEIVRRKKQTPEEKR